SEPQEINLKNAAKTDNGAIVTTSNRARPAEQPKPAKPKGGSAVVVGACLIAAVKIGRDRGPQQAPPLRLLGWGTAVGTSRGTPPGSPPPSPSRGPQQAPLLRLLGWRCDPHREEDLRPSAWKFSGVVLSRIPHICAVFGRSRRDKIFGLPRFEIRLNDVPSYE